MKLSVLTLGCVCLTKVFSGLKLNLQCNTPIDELDKPSKEEIFKKRLRKELVSRDGHG